MPEGEAPATAYPLPYPSKTLSRGTLATQKHAPLRVPQSGHRAKHQQVGHLEKEMGLVPAQFPKVASTGKNTSSQPSNFESKTRRLPSHRLAPGGPTLPAPMHPRSGI